MGRSDVQGVWDTVPENIAEPEKKSYFYWEAHKKYAFQQIAQFTLHIPIV
jgi:hypothetical protein